jgi:PKD repeat protein
MNIPEIYLAEPYNAYAPKGKKKHWHQVIEEEALMARIIAEQQARQQAEQQAIIQEAKSRTLPPQAPPESVPPIVGNTAGAGSAGEAGSAPGGGGMPVWDFWSGGNEIVNFSATPLPGGDAPLTVQFTNLTPTPQFDTYTWNFGDGATSNDINPSHVYQSGSAGGYNVQLTASHEASPSVSVSKAGYISSSIPTVTAAFTFTTSSIHAPFSASFTNTTTNTSQTPMTTYLWTFTGGTPATSTAASPSISVAAGNFTASLQSTGSYDIASEVTVMFSASI